jgi:hypothetical protein
MDKHKYDRAVRCSAGELIRGILSEDPDEAGNHLDQSRKGLLQALSLRDAVVELNGQQFLRRSILDQVGNEILDQARKQLFNVVFPRCNAELRMDVAAAFDAMQKRFRELTLPVLH